MPINNFCSQASYSNNKMEILQDVNWLPGGSETINNLFPHTPAYKGASVL